jgi:hypothetical protein
MGVSLSSRAFTNCSRRTLPRGVLIFVLKSSHELGKILEITLLKGCLCSVIVLLFFSPLIVLSGKCV